MLPQLTDQDAIFLYGETSETPAHVGGLSLVDLPEGYRGDFFADYKATIASRMALVPFLHTRVARVPFDLDRPFWVEDEHIDLDHHVRRATVPPPGTMAELEALIAVLHQQPLDRTRPLWEFTVIDGLASGQLAIYTKMHHAAMDGGASQQLITTMYDPTPTPRVLACPAPDIAHRPSARNLVTSLLARRAQQAIRALQFVPELVQAVSHMVLPDRRRCDFARSSSTGPPSAPRASRRRARCLRTSRRPRASPDPRGCRHDAVSTSPPTARAGADPAADGVARLAGGERVARAAAGVAPGAARRRPPRARAPPASPRERG